MRWRQQLEEEAEGQGVSRAKTILRLWTAALVGQDAIRATSRRSEATGACGGVELHDARPALKPTDGSFHSFKQLPSLRPFQVSSQHCQRHIQLPLGAPK